MMPLDEEHGQANREDARYCTHCFRDGRLCYEGNDLKEFDVVSEVWLIVQKIDN
jgi:hypothetical protein